jgi:tRNA threonylcarbamoyladenosine biosynthesis protein TsaB
LPGRTASERLVATIRDLAGTNLHSLNAVAVVHGPGSFTGVRVGLSAAKGLCHALQVPLVAISRLAVLAYLAGSARVHALLDAGRGDFYHGLYQDGLCLGESLVTRDQLLATLSVEAAPLLVVCEPAVAESLAAYSPRLLAEPTSANALPLALRRLQLNQVDDPATIDANYLRRTDAEIFAKPIIRSVAPTATP